MNIPESFEGSRALQLVVSQGWDWKLGTSPNIILGKCPHCGKESHCYMEIHGQDDQKNRDGLYLCQRCGKCFLLQYGSSCRRLALDQESRGKARHGRKLGKLGLGKLSLAA